MSVVGGHVQFSRYSFSRLEVASRREHALCIQHDDTFNLHSACLLLDLCKMA
jgi:hypothetical protein